MANPQNLIKHRYPKGVSGNLKGRPLNIEKVLKNYFQEEHNLKLSNSQVNDMLIIILSKTKDEIISMAKDDKLPWWIALIANKINRDFKKGSMHVLDSLLDRVYGKPTERSEVTTDGKIEVVFTQGKTIL